MKTLFVTLLTMISISNAAASVVFEVTGELSIIDKMNAPLEMSISTEHGVFELTNVHTPFRSCVDGRYAIVNNMYPQGTYTLLEVIDCVPEFIDYKFEENQVTICPEIYLPVCGQPKMPKCAKGFACIQVMPAPVVYGNLCELKAAKAQPLPAKSCGEF